MVRLQSTSGILNVAGVTNSETGGIQLRFRSPDADGRLSVDEVSDGISVEFDGVPVEEFELTQETSQDLSVSIAFDVSGSMQGEPLEVAKESAVSLVNSVPDGTPISLVSFGNQANLVQEATTNKEAVVDAINSLEANGETALYDGIVQALNSQDANFAENENGASGSSVVLVITDGGDTVSESTLQEVTASLESSAANVNAISIDTDESSVGNLNTLVGENGSVFQASSIGDLGSILDGLAANLSEQFVVSLPPGVGSAGNLAVQVETSEGGVFSFTRDIALTTDVRAALGPQPDPVIFEGGQVNVFGGVWALYVGAALVVLSVLGVIVALAAGRESKATTIAARSFGAASTESKIDAFTDLRIGAAKKLEEAIGDSESAGGLATLLEKAAIGIRVGELILMMGVAGIIGFFVGLIQVNIIVGVLLALVFAMLPRAFVAFKAWQREKAISSQLPDFISILANTLKAGFSLQQALVATSAEMEEPLGTELHRVLVESRIGGNLIKALREMAARINSDDMTWVIDAIEINQTVGGDLVEVLESVGNTIRERITLRAQVSALAAEGKMSASVLFALPPLLLVAIAVVNPTYFEGLSGEPLTYVVIGVELVLLTVGGSWLWKMVKAVTP